MTREEGTINDVFYNRVRKYGDRVAIEKTPEEMAQCHLEPILMVP